jgi:hypothetical protein
MNELFKTLAAHVEREAKTVASHFRSYAIDMAADATLAKLLTAASAALQAVHEHLERRREDGRPSEAVKIKAHPAPSTPSLGAGAGWTTAALEWPCVGYNHNIAIGDYVYFSPLGGGTTYCRKHAPLYDAPPVGQPLWIERLSFVVSGLVTSDQPFELTLAPDVGIGVHALLHNAEPGTVQFESVQVEGKEPTPYRELLREFRADYVMHCPKGKNVTVRGKLMGVGMSHRLTVQFFGRKLRFD